MKYSLSYLDSRFVGPVDKIIAADPSMKIVEVNRLDTFIRIETNQSLGQVKQLLGGHCVVSQVIE